MSRQIRLMLPYQLVGATGHPGWENARQPSTGEYLKRLFGRWPVG